MSFIKRDRFFKSFAQSGEDTIIHFLLNSMKVKKPFYIDVGAYHPTKMSNTYSFYLMGGEGVCIDANPLSCEKIRRKRPRDKVITCAVTPATTDEMDFYLINAATLSTLDRSQMERVTLDPKYHVSEIIRVPARPMADLLAEYADRHVDLFSLDIEADMVEILSSINFASFRPSVMCIETLAFDPGGRGLRDRALIAHVVEQGYVIYADTYINTIFVDPSKLPFVVDPLFAVPTE